MSQAYKYFAFISYSRKDSKVAAWLQKRLEWFRFPVKLVPKDRQPPNPKYVRPVYRDKTNLEVTDEHYWTNIRRALEESRFLIVLCSPRSAKSEPVNMEVKHFLEVHGGDASLVAPVIVSGSVTSESEDAALCPALRTLRDHDGKTLIDRNLATMVPDAVTAEQDAWEQGFVSLISYVLRLERRVLGDHIQRETKRQGRVLRRWLAAVGLLAVTAVCGAWVAILAKRDVEAASKVIVAKSEEVEKANRVIMEKNQKITIQNETNLKNLHDASMADYSVAVQRMGKDARWREGVAHLARALDREPRNPSPAMRLYGTIVLKAHDEADLLRCVLSHDDGVESASFSSDGTHVVTASQDHTARVWDAVTGKPLGEPMRHEDWVNSASFSPDGKRVVTASNDKTARVWDSATGKPLGKPMRHNDVVWRAWFSPDSTRIVTASTDNTARLWDAATGKPLCEPLRHGNSVYGASFSPDGKRVVTASNDKTARLWDATTGKPLGEPMRHEDWVNSASFSPDGKRVVTASNDHTARLWDATTGKPLGEPMGHGNVVHHASFSPDGSNVLTTTADGTSRAWDAATGMPLGEPMSQFYGTHNVSFSPDGSHIVTATRDHTARVWDAATGKPLGEPMRHESDVRSASFSPDGTRILTASWDNTARLWDAVTGKPLGEPVRHGGEVRSASFSPDGKCIVTASEDTTARLWNAATGRPLGEPMRHESDVRSANFSPDGKCIVTAGGKTVRRWDASTGKPLGEPLRPGNVIFSASFSPDGSRIVTAEGMVFDKARTDIPRAGKAMDMGSFGSGEARIWEAASGKALGEPMRHDGWVNSASFSPDGTRIITASEDLTAQLWDASTCQPVGEPMRHGNWYLSSVKSASFSRDGARIVTASADEGGRLWDAATGKALGAGVQGRSASFSPDGMLIVTASLQGTARLWDAASGKVVGEPMRHENMSSDEAASVSLRGQRGIESAGFSPDGTRIVTAGNDGTARLWELKSLLQLPAETPEWVREWARAVAGWEFNSEGEMQQMPGTKRLRILSTAHEGDDPWSRLARWLATDSAKRTTHPDSPHTCREIAERERDFGSGESLKSALRYDPTVPLARLLLAGELQREDAKKPASEQNQSLPQQAAFLRDYDLQRLPDDAILWSRASESLLNQEQPSMALKAARKAVSLDAGQIAAQRALAYSLDASGEQAEALNAWDKVLAGKEATFSDFSDAGYLAAVLNQGDKARAIFRQGEQRFPSSPRILRFKGKALLLLHAPADALAALQAYETKLAAYDGSKPLPDAVAALAVSRWLIGDKDGAVADYQRLIGLVAVYADIDVVTKSGWPDATKQPMLEVLAETLQRHPDLVPKPPAEMAGALPYGIPIPGRPGFVRSPFAAKNQLVNVTGLPVGMEVKCPYSGKLFRVPAQ